MTVISNRSCGGCTACCKTHAIFEIKKPVGKWCPYCDASKGCRIYLNHPKSCKKFRCEWLKGFGEDGDRPDRTKIVLDFCTGGVLPKFLQIWEVSGKALRESFAKESAQLAIGNEIPVILIHISGKIELVAGNIILPKESLNKFDAAGVKIIQKY